VEYSYLGNSGLVVSKLGFGAMTFATDSGMPFANLSKADAATVIDQLLDAGVTLFDSANVYCNGQSESILSELLGARRKDVIIVTKGGSRAGRSPNEVGLSARHLHMEIEGSLKRLNSDWIDVYLCHLPDLRAPLEETLFALDQIVRSGKARYVGYSNWPAWLASKAVATQKALGFSPFIAGQYQYSLLDREPESEMVPAMLDAGVGMMAYSPLASGVLTGKYNTADAGTDGRLAKLSFLPNRAHDKQVIALVEAMRAIAQAKHVSVASLALAWVKQQPSVSTVLLGINKVAQLADNLAAADLVLSEAEQQELGNFAALPVRYPHSLFSMLGGDGWPDPRDRAKTPAYANSGAWRAQTK
jgi:aryl-alcohol dehydrogenase-like predicted oxidoreductase